MATDVGSIIAHLVLDRRDFTDGLAAARTEAKDPIEIRAILNSKEFDAEWARLMAMKAMLGGGPESSASINTSAFAASAAAVEAMKSAIGRGVEVPVRFAVSGSGVALDMQRESWLHTLDAAMGNNALSAVAGGGANKRVDIYYHASERDQTGGGMGFGGLASALLFGGGSKVPFLGTMAGLGSLASFAGLGPEHLVMTALGLAGSAAGGLIGGGLLGAGALATGAVGMGTDMAGIGQAAGDIKTIYGDINNVNQAMALYGKTSSQVGQAQAQLNLDMAGFSPVAGQAVFQAAQAVETFKSLFDLYTGPAEKIGAQIITQLIQVGDKFLPTIGSFATQNMRIIQQGIQPLLAWLQGPGMTIFNQLETRFQQDLPYAVHAFGQAFEFVAKTISFVLSDNNGGMIFEIDRFITKMNSPAGFAKWSSEVGKLIGDFHLWSTFIRAIVDDIVYLFQNDAGTASGIVGSLTQMLQKLGDWEQSTRGKQQLQSIFATHKQEVLDLLKLIPPLASSMGNIYLTVAPAMTRALTTVLQAMAPVLAAIAKNPIGAWMLGLIIIAGRLGILKPLLSPVASAIGGLAGALGGAFIANIKSFAESAYLLTIMGWERLVGGLRAAAAAMFGFDAAVDANALGLIVLSIVGTIAALALLVLEWKKVTHFLQTDWGTAVQIALAVMVPFIGLPLVIMLHWQGLVGFFDGIWQTIDRDTRNWFGDTEKWLDGAWQTVDRNARHWFGDVEGFFTGVWQHIYTDAIHWWSNLVNFFVGIWQHIDTDARHWWGNIESFFATVLDGIKFIFGKLPGVLFGYAKDAMNELIKGAESVNVVGFFTGLFENLVKKGLSILHINSPSKVFYNMGRSMMTGLEGGIKDHYLTPANALTAALGNIAASGGGLMADVLKAMNVTGVPSSWLSPLMSIIQHESGGNPNAINLTDINAQMGHPSEGLMQTIGSTFAAYALPGFNTNIFDPVSNVIAGIRYILAAYGSVFNVPGIVSMAHGGPYVGYAGGTGYASGGMAWVGERGPELMYVPRGAKIIPHGQASFGGGISFASSHNISVSVNGGDPSMVEAAVCKALDKHDAEILSTLKQIAGVGL